MPTCSHCGETFDDDEAYLSHLADRHEDDLGRIERRRIAEHTDDVSAGLPTGPIVLGGVVLIGVAIVAYVLLFMGSNAASGSDGPGPLHSAHEHGTMEMVVLGERVDFSQSQYQLQADRFHFEAGNGRIWHTHATGVTLSWALSTLGFNVTENSVTYQGTTYRDASENYSVQVTVDGQAVDPTTHVLNGVDDPQNAPQGDTVRIVVEAT